MLALLLSGSIADTTRSPIALCVEGNYTCDGQCLADGAIVKVHEDLNELKQYTTAEGELTQFFRNNIHGGPVSAETEDCAPVPGAISPVHMQCATTIDHRSGASPVVLEVCDPAYTLQSCCPL